MSCHGLSWAIMRASRLFVRRGRRARYPSIAKRTHFVRMYSKQGICEKRARHKAGKMAGGCEDATTQRSDATKMRAVWTKMDAETDANARQMNAIEREMRAL